MTTRCGFIALMGRPNAGKSTLLNALVGEKLAVVSRKPQTTRNRILGVVLHEKTQIVLLDSPGIHKTRGKTRLNSTLNRVAFATGADADLVLYLADVTTGFDELDRANVERILATTDAPILLLATKRDAAKRQWVALASEKIRDAIDGLPRERFLEPVPLAISAKRPDDVQALKARLAEFMPEGPWLYESDALTDRPQTFLAAELVREQLFRMLGEEIPYGTAVKVHRIEDKESIVVVEATILVARSSHKPIVLGKRGVKIKEIGSAARASLERHFDKKVYLDLTVEVQEDWVNDPASITDLAHLTEADLPSG